MYPPPLGSPHLAAKPSLPSNAHTFYGKAAQKTKKEDTMFLRGNLDFLTSKETQEVPDLIGGWPTLLHREHTCWTTWVAALGLSLPAGAR